MAIAQNRAGCQPKLCSKIHRKKVTFLLLVFLAFAGCCILKKEMGTPIDVTGVKLKEGETHYSTVVHQLGPPAKVNALPRGLVFLYENISTTETQIGIDLDIDMVPWLKWFKASYGLKQVRREQWGSSVGKASNHPSRPSISPKKLPR